MKTIRWNVEKYDRLKRERGVTFEEVVYHIEQSDVIDITQHPNQEKYPGQQIYVIQMHDYIHLAVCRRNDYGSAHERFSGVKRPLVSVETAQNGVFHRFRSSPFRSQARGNSPWVIRSSKRASV